MVHRIISRILQFEHDAHNKFATSIVASPNDTHIKNVDEFKTKYKSIAMNSSSTTITDAKRIETID